MSENWSPEEEEKAKAFAREIVERRMAMPAVLLLEGIRPLHFIGGQFLHFMAPIGGILAPGLNLDRLGNFLEHRGSVPFIVDEIERLEAERLAAKRQPNPDRADPIGSVTESSAPSSTTSAKSSSEDPPGR